MVWCLTKQMDNVTFALTTVKYADKTIAHIQQYTHLHCVAMEREICEYAAQQRYWDGYITDDLCWALLDGEVHHQTAT
jgi:hypothetical protein